MSRNVLELVRQMTLEEKASLCSGFDFWHTKSIDRLGIPQMMVSDGPHGLRKQDMGGDHLGMGASVPATCFPTAAGLACSWNRELSRKVGETIAEECQQEQVGILLGPGVNIKRSPLCGRNFEYYSEDPLLAGELGAAFTVGVQSGGIGTSLKHFAANNQETRRMGVSAVVGERTLMEIYLMPFEYVVKKAKPWTVMCSYNRINGEFACQHEELLTKVLREMWGYDGYVMTDWGAMDQRVPSLIAGTELEMPASGGRGDALIVEAVKNGSLDVKILDRAVERMLNILFRWDATKRPETRYDIEDHYMVARKAASESMVLIKNEDGILPYKKGDYVVIGEYGQNISFQGGGSSHINPTKVDCLPDELAQATGSNVTFEKGYHADGHEDDPLTQSAVAAARLAKNVVIVLGLSGSFLSEGIDRPHMRLADNQNKLTEAVLSVRPDATIVITCGSPVELPWIDKAKAVLIAYLGGQGSAGAVCDILTGAVNPSGKLAETWPKRLEHNPSFLNFPGSDEVHYSEGIYVGYRYYEKKKIEPLFSFGEGLSYTSFEYSDISVDKETLTEDETVTVCVDVKNIGTIDGSEIIQLYVRDMVSSIDRPEKELKGFEKICLKAGEKKTVQFTLDSRAFSFWDETSHRWAVETGSFEIRVGSSSVYLPLSVTVEVKSLHVLIKKLTPYSTMGELLEIPEGKQMVTKMLAGLADQLGMQVSNMEQGEMPPAGGPGAGDMLGMDVMEMMRGMPIKTLSSFAGDAFTIEMMEGFIDNLNKIQQSRQ